MSQVAQGHKRCGDRRRSLHSSHSRDRSCSQSRSRSRSRSRSHSPRNDRRALKTDNRPSRPAVRAAPRSSSFSSPPSAIASPASLPYVVYVLRCRGGKYYVGRVDAGHDVDKRVMQHREGTGTGAAWTKLHPPIELVSQEPADKWAEDLKVVQLMEVHGVANVRGGAYSQVVLRASQIEALETELRSANDQCHICGCHGHFMNQCPNRNQGNLLRPETSTRRPAASIPAAAGDTSAAQPAALACYRCGRTSHFAANCYAFTDVEGNALDDDSIEEAAVSAAAAAASSARPAALACHRCGRTSHFAAKCYASTDVEGNALDDDSAEEAGNAIVCFRCGRPGHLSTQCYANRDVEGRPI